MAEAVAETIVGKLVEYLVDALKDQVSYLCCYSCNVTKLGDEVGELNVRYESVEEGVGAARNNIESIAPVVTSWLREVEEVWRESNRIRIAADEVGRRSCLCKWLPVLHYSLSRDAVNTTEVAIKLRKETPPVPMFHPRVPAEIDPIPATSETGFKSRNFIEDQIINALKDERVYLIGLCGMGGIGKTTMAKQIEKRVRDQKSMFDHVVMAIVSQQPDLPKIQNEIAEGLGLELKEKSLMYRARKLHERLMAEKGVLIILDDVWERLNLEELGIPSQRTHAGCKLILTSRDDQAFILTGNPVSKIFRLEVLNDEESWILFKDNAGSGVDSPDLIQIAKDIACECNGLPLALKTVGCALRNRSKSSWDDALVELQKSMPMNVPGVVKDVYQPLMYSINQLESEEARYLFLLCCLFPEDYKISLKDLVRLVMGLRIFEDLENLTVARNRVETVLNILISRSLLIHSSDEWDNLYVKIHDVIRDVGIWIASKKKIESEGKIASKEKHVFMVSHGKEEWPMTEEESYGNYTCISLLFCRHDVVIPEFMDCPRLEFLGMNFVESWKKIYLNTPENFFDGMRRLRVLVASGFGSLPSSMGLLNNLRTLHLSGCRMFEKASMIGKLINLEILCLESCKIDVLPTEIGGLKKLRQLYISNCQKLGVPFGVISGLVRLEELVISSSFVNWEAEANGTTNARLDELDFLDHLTTLKIQIRNSSAIPKQMPLWVQKVKKQNIAVGSYFVPPSCKAIILGRQENIPLGDWFYDMASDAEYVHIEGPSSVVVERLRNQNCVKYLHLYWFSDVQYLVGAEQNDAIFPTLKSLSIIDSPSLQEISNVPPLVGSFKALEEVRLQRLSALTCLWKFPTEKLCLSNLKRVWLHYCANLAYLFNLSITQSLSQLEKLEVLNCPIMKEIFKKEDGEMEINKIEFPKLNYLSLKSMGSLCRLVKGVDEIEVPTLSRLDLENLPSIIDFHQRCLFEQQFAGNISGLQILRVKRIHNLKCLFSPSILSRVSNLKELTLEDCLELEEVIAKDENVGETILFPRLEKLNLRDLPKIFTFCCTGVELPSLKELRIQSCSLMERFFQGLFDISNSRLCLPFFGKEFAGNISGLQILRLQGIHNLKCLFSPSILSHFSNLKELVVRDCSKLEEVIGKEENVGETILFPSLEELNLSNLPRILTFCYTRVELPSLEDLIIQSCPLMERFSRGLSDISNSRFSLPFFSQEVHCPKLKILYLINLPSIARIFSPSTFRAFRNLEWLSLEDSKELQEVIAKEEVEELTNIKEILSPQLEFFHLHRLPKIHRFCHMKHCLEFPLLTSARITDCPMLERFSLGPLHLPNFTRVDGLPNADFATKFFFNKEITSHQIHLDNNCFTISAREISRSSANLEEVCVEWFLAPDLSESFVDAVELFSYESMEMVGNFDTEKLPAGVAFEIRFMIMLDLHWEEAKKKAIQLELTLPGGITQQHIEFLDKLPRGKWIELSLGKFTREPHQSGQLEFALCQQEGGELKLSVKGVRIVKA